MIYITGDLHRDFTRVFAFARKKQTTKEDILIVLGDVGINYYLDDSDKTLKEKLQELPLTLFCIQGNHEERPENISSYKETNNIFLVILCVMVFITCGFEHSIANMFFFALSGQPHFIYLIINILGNSLGAIGAHKFVK